MKSPKLVALFLTLLSSPFAQASSRTILHENCRLYWPIRGGIVAHWADLSDMVMNRGYQLAGVRIENFSRLPERQLFSKMEYNRSKSISGKRCEVKLSLFQITGTNPFRSKKLYVKKSSQTSHNWFSGSYNCEQAIEAVFSEFPICEIGESS